MCFVESLIASLASTPLPIVTTRNASRHCQLSPGEQNHLYLRTIAPSDDDSGIPSSAPSLPGSPGGVSFISVDSTPIVVPMLPTFHFPSTYLFFWVLGSECLLHPGPPSGFQKMESTSQLSQIYKRTPLLHSPRLVDLLCLQS